MGIMSKNAITLAVKVQIIDFLKQPDVLISPEPGWCRYVNGWTDQNVAYHFVNSKNTLVTKSNVAGVRTQMFGVIMPEAAPAKSELKPELDAAIARINALEASMRDMQVQIQRLELALKHNR